MAVQHLSKHTDTKHRGDISFVSWSVFPFTKHMRSVRKRENESSTDANVPQAKANPTPLSMPHSLLTPHTNTCEQPHTHIHTHSHTHLQPPQVQSKPRTC